MKTGWAIMFSRKYFGRCAAFVLLLAVLCGKLLTAGAEDAAGHFLLSDMDVGHCKRLTGDVVLTVVFVDTPDAPYDRESRQRWTANMDAAMEWLEQEAERYGAQLHMTAQYHSVYVEEAVVHIGDDVAGWVQTVLAADSALPSYQQEESALMCGPVLFCVEAYGRAFACSNPGEDILEYYMLYQNSEWRSVCHELMHLFGAWDYYTHDEVAQAAAAIYTTGIMLDGGQISPVDSLTAYVIGWTDVLDADAQAMLDATAHLTEDDMDAAVSKHVLDGYRTEVTQGGVYTGWFQDGMYHDWGRMEWNDGSVYEGEWRFSVRTGYGTMSWADGSEYTGFYQDGKLHGWGRMQWADGTTYEGEWQSGECTGFGIKRWPDGAVYTGDFLNGQYHGQGTLVFSDGTFYTGGFAYNTYSGEGLYVWPQGCYYKGAYENGTYHGYGVYRDINGTVMEGQWDQGAFIQ